MSMRAWFGGAGAAATAIELATGAFAIVHLGPTRIALYPVACAIATAAATLLLWRLLEPSSGGPGGGDGRDGGGEDRPPPWWPQFERDLREYARERRAPVEPS